MSAVRIALGEAVGDLHEPLIRCVQDGNELGREFVQFVHADVVLSRLTVPKPTAEPVSLELWAADDYEDSARLIGVVNLGSVNAQDPPVHVTDAPFIDEDDCPLELHGLVCTVSCTVEAVEAGPVRGEEVVPQELLSVVTIRNKTLSSLTQVPIPPAGDAPTGSEEGLADELAQRVRGDFRFMSGNKYTGQVSGATMIGEGNYVRLPDQPP